MRRSSRSSTEASTSYATDLVGPGESGAGHLPASSSRGRAIQRSRRNAKCDQNNGQSDTDGEADDSLSVGVFGSVGDRVLDVEEVPVSGHGGGGVDEVRPWAARELSYEHSFSPRGGAPSTACGPRSGPGVGEDHPLNKARLPGRQLALRARLVSSVTASSWRGSIVVSFMTYLLGVYSLLRHEDGAVWDSETPVGPAPRRSLNNMRRPGRRIHLMESGTQDVHDAAPTDGRRIAVVSSRSPQEATHLLFARRFLVVVGRPRTVASPGRRPDPPDLGQTAPGARWGSGYSGGPTPAG